MPCKVIKNICEWSSLTLDYKLVFSFLAFMYNFLKLHLFFSIFPHLFKIQIYVAHFQQKIFNKILNKLLQKNP